VTIRNLRDLTYPTKILFSAFLVTVGIGYLMAVAYLFLIDVAPYDTTGLHVVQDTIQKYYGRRGDTLLEGVLDGGMGQYVSREEKEQILSWINSGASQDGFKDVAPIFEKKCTGCHSPTSGMGLPPLTGYDEVKKVTKVDRGESIKILAKTSHVHLFGISMLFLLTGAIFSLGRMNGHLKGFVLAFPYIAILMDIGSWWFTKFNPIFAYTVIVGGVLMGVSLAVQILYSIYEMWLGRKT